MNPAVESESKGKVIMQVKGMTKTFGPVVALDKVDLTVRRGEIRGLIGENGSGKSTVTSIFSGMQKADSGEMYFEGETWAPASMHEALDRGVGMIVQESGTVAGITVAENIFLCDTARFTKGGFVNRREMMNAAQKALDDIGASHIRADMMTEMLDMMDRKLVEVAKVWMRSPQIIVVDETTTSLSQKGRNIIYDLIERMKNSNRSVVFISHDLDEIMERCDTLTVLRDGKIIRTFEKEEFNEEAIKTSMIGRELQGDYYRSDYDGSHGEEVVLKIEDGTYHNRIKHLTLEAHKGEILGIGGLSHCGMHTLGKILYGAIKPESGKVTVKGKLLRSPSQAMKLGVGYAAKDRDIESLCMSASIRDNIAIAGLDRFAIGNVFVTSSKEKKYVAEQIDRMQVKCFSMDQPVSQLSGGNKQKVVFGKWIGCGSDILILDCPTRGIDIGVKQMMYQMMYKMKKEGKTIIMISEEMTELMGMADRLIIMKDGSITKEFQRSESLTDAEIIRYMI